MILKSKLTNLVYTLFLLSIIVTAQEKVKKIKLEGDFRFRIEQDWNSRKSDGTFRDDRSRLRYRLRAGATYQHNDWASVGARIRTGDPKKQQDPQLTLGDGFNEFGTLPIALEKAYFKAEKDGFTAWFGKNTFPYEKKNELFWSDNVYPEGVFLKKAFSTASGPIDEISISGGHFVINARGSSFDQDSYFQGFQAVANLWNKRWQLYPSIYLFKNIQDIPDGAATFLFDYSIIHLGTSIKPFESYPVTIELDYYQNLENYDSNTSIPIDFKDEKTAWSMAIGYGNLKKKSDWVAKVTYTHLEKYAAVDFLAQNDWARWDYSSFDSPDGRLTNLQGLEFVLGHMIGKNMSIKMKYYWVEQLVPTGTTLENGQRIRLDFDIRI